MLRQFYVNFVRKYSAKYRVPRIFRQNIQRNIQVHIVLPTPHENFGEWFASKIFANFTAIQWIDLTSTRREPSFPVFGPHTTDKPWPTVVSNVTNITRSRWHFNTDHDFQALTVCTDQTSEWWQSHSFQIIGRVDLSIFARLIPVSTSPDQCRNARRKVGICNDLHGKLKPCVLFQ